MNSSTFYTAANYYAQKFHIPVFPCVAKGKQPITPHGCKDATTDAGQIDVWWKETPNANVAIATGGGLVVLDVDIDHDAGKFGDETLADLEREHGPLPDTWISLTGGGGIHYFFACNDPALTVAAGFAPGLDYRGAGGYVIAPPSIHPNGNTYEWEASSTPANCPLAPLPNWLHEMMLAGKKGDGKAGKFFEVPEKIEQGKRNETLFKMASSLRAKGHSKSEIMALLMIANRERCRPSLPEDEVKRIVESAGKFEPGKIEATKSDIPERDVDATLTFTLKEIEAGLAYEYLAGIKIPYRQGMELERLSKVAKSVKFDGFKKHFREYLQSLESAKSPKSEAEDSQYSEFEDQPLELFTGEWRTDNSGVWRYQNSGKEMACSHPIMPVQILRSVDTRRYKVKLIFKRGGNKSKKSWDEVVVESEKLASATKIVDALSPAGVSVTSGKRAYALVDYLRDLLDWNIDSIPEIKSVSRMGWNDEGFFPYTGLNIAFDSVREFDQAYRAINQIGSYEAWLKEARDARAYSLTSRIVIAASFASPLIDPLGVNCFIVHLWGGSGTGKTVAQMLGAAVWANPAVGGPYFSTFDSTSVALEVMAGFLHSIPLFVDEYQLKGQKDFNPYQLTEGAGKKRSNQNLGLNYVPEWKLISITSGEEPITKDTDPEGVQNRVFEIECRRGVKVIQNGHKTAGVLKKNYGHAGKDFITRLAEESQLDRARKLYKEFYEELSESNTTDKQAMAAAAILVGDALATEWIFKDNRALTAKEISDFLKTKETVSIMERGYQILCDFVAVNAARFRGVQEDGSQTCYGVVEDGVAYIIRSTFNQVCADNNIDNKALLSHLRSAGLIITGKKGYTKTFYIGGGLSPNCVWMKLPEEKEEDETEIL